MSISLKQLTAMVDIAETLAIEMRELIALRQIVANRAAAQSRTVTARPCPPLNLDSQSRSPARIPRAKVAPARPPASI